MSPARLPNIVLQLLCLKQRLDRHSRRFVEIVATIFQRATRMAHADGACAQHDGLLFSGRAGSKATV
jgi:hypothetical protein